MNKIKKNVNELKRKVKKTPYSSLFDQIGSISVSNLTWEDALSSQVLRMTCPLYKSCHKRSKKLSWSQRKMVPERLPAVVSKACNKFANNPDVTREALLHDGAWKEADDK